VISDPSVDIEAIQSGDRDNKCVMDRVINMLSSLDNMNIWLLCVTSRRPVTVFSSSGFTH
jgi:hypothetical protein